MDVSSTLYSRLGQLGWGRSVFDDPHHLFSCNRLIVKLIDWGWRYWEPLRVLKGFAGTTIGICEEAFCCLGVEGWGIVLLDPLSSRTLAANHHSDLAHSLRAFLASRLALDLRDTFCALLYILISL